MTVRREARCQCGALGALCEGEPVRASVCHCLDCQRRSGSAFAAQARFPADKVTITGEARVWTRRNESGSRVDFSFCPTCGSGVFYRLNSQPDLIAVPIGGFADTTLPPPDYSVFETRKHPWVAIVGDVIDHLD